MFPKGVTNIINSYISYKPLYLKELLTETSDIKKLLDKGWEGNENLYWKRGDITKIIYFRGWSIAEKNGFWTDLYWSHQNKKQFRKCFPYVLQDVDDIINS